MSTREKTPASFVVWQCGCSDVRVNAADLPEKCPGHDSPPIQSPEQIDCLTEFVGVHECDVDGFRAGACPTREDS